MILKYHRQVDSCWGRWELECDPLWELSENMTLEEEIEKCKELNAKYGDVDGYWYGVAKEPIYYASNKVHIPGMCDKNGRLIK